MNDGPPRSPDPLAEHAARQIEAIRRRLEWRIRPVVAHWPEPEIQSLLLRMAWVKFKYDGERALSSTPAEQQEPAREERRDG